MEIRAALGLALFWLAFAPVTVRADSEPGNFACMRDALTLCGQFIPDRERVAACLKSNHNRVSADCRAALKRFK
ncbi:MAG: hypothetical protein ABSE22_22010 [Xanthobacteraceae bacterium]|jgi:hypothetical protein